MPNVAQLCVGVRRQRDLNLILSQSSQSRRLSQQPCDPVHLLSIPFGEGCCVHGCSGRLSSLFSVWIAGTFSCGSELGDDFRARTGRWKVLDAVPAVAVGCGTREGVQAE